MPRYAVAVLYILDVDERASTQAAYEIGRNAYLDSLGTIVNYTTGEPMELQSDESGRT